MAKQMKPKAKRTQVKDLPVVQQELTTDEAAKVKGGSNASYSGSHVLYQDVFIPTSPSKPPTSLPSTIRKNG